jgi:hypothetical protein
MSDRSSPPDRASLHTEPTKTRGGAPDMTWLPAKTQGTLEYGWWASNGPTAGYLMRLALDAIGDAGVRRIDLRVTRLAAAASFELTFDGGTDPADPELLRGTFNQDRPFATVSVLRVQPYGTDVGGDATPPAALPSDAYRPMPTPSPTLPPVTGRFVYRPGESDDNMPRPGWDVVWLAPTDEQLQGRALIASMLDSWYPPHFMRSVREHLRIGAPLEQPQTTVLLAASMSFTAPDAAYAHTHDNVMASQATATADGHYFERLEIWSDRGQLLATAEIVRRLQVHARLSNRS